MSDKIVFNKKIGCIKDARGQYAVWVDGSGNGKHWTRPGLDVRACVRRRGVKRLFAGARRG